MRNRSPTPQYAPDAPPTPLTQPLRRPCVGRRGERWEPRRTTLWDFTSQPWRVGPPEASAAYPRPPGPPNRAGPTSEEEPQRTNHRSAGGFWHFRCPLRRRRCARAPRSSRGVGPLSTVASRCRRRLQGQRSCLSWVPTDPSWWEWTVRYAGGARGPWHTSTSTVAWDRLLLPSPSAATTVVAHRGRADPTQPLTDGPRPWPRPWPASLRRPTSRRCCSPRRWRARNEKEGGDEYGDRFSDNSVSFMRPSRAGFRGRPCGGAPEPPPGCL